MKRILIFTLMLTILSASIAVADVPQMINYQGRLTDSEGAPVDATLSMVFTIYDDSTEGNPIWTETHSSVTVTTGLFNVILGDGSPPVPMHDTVFNDPERYLGIRVGGDSEIEPRTALITVPYAYHALRADTAAYALSAPCAGGDITAVNADNGLTGGGTTDDVVLYIDSAWIDTFVDTCNVRYADDAGFADSAEAITDGAVDFDDIGQNGAASGQVMKWVGGVWVAGNDEIGSGGWVDDGTNVRLETQSDNVGIGTTTPSEKLDVNGNVRASGTLRSGNSITIDGVNDMITASGGTIDFDDENLVTIGKATIGPGHTNTGTDAFVAGANNNARGDYSVVSGGGGATTADSNAANGDWSAVGGGLSNRAAAASGTISGGNSNEILGGSDASTIAGGQENVISNSAIHGTIGGGWSNSVSANKATIGGGSGNNASHQFCTIGGGLDNTASDYRATVGGGWENTASGENATVAGGQNNAAAADYATVAGGYDNDADSSFCTVSGGASNKARGTKSTVGGGAFNIAGFLATVAGGEMNFANGHWGTIAGGTNNESSAKLSSVGGGIGNRAEGEYSTVSGGNTNIATGNYSAIAGGYSCEAAGDYSFTYGNNGIAKGDYSFAGGNNASALHDGAFVFADASGEKLESTAPNQVLFRASGGTKFYSDSKLSSGVTIHPGSSAWAVSSDRNLKENFSEVDGSELLSKLAQLPITEWNYKSQDGDVRHIGPVAQDFYTLFGLGDDDVTISTIDPAGIALAAIQELHKKNVDLEAEVAELKALVQKLLEER
ncbi:MAG: tail fiber domain-containing protein [Candidatus Zixiibacteriota bacterium]